MPFIEIGCSPNNVDCVQVSRHRDYMADMKAELNAYKHQLQRLYPPPEGCYFAVKFHPHDFGQYGEVRAVYTSDYNQEQVDWAYGAEAGAEDWDAEALKELAEHKVKSQV